MNQDMIKKPIETLKIGKIKTIFFITSATQTDPDLALCHKSRAPCNQRPTYGPTEQQTNQTTKRLMESRARDQKLFE